MDKSSVLLVCTLVLACSAWMGVGKRLEVSTDDQEQGDVENSVEAEKLPGVCWACKWALNKLRKNLKSNVTQEDLKKKLLSVCNQIGLLKRLCLHFVKTHLSILIEELTTTDTVEMICVKTRACKQKELMDLLLMFANEEDPQTQINDIS